MVELIGDEPEAVEVLLQHIYGYDYDEIVEDAEYDRFESDNPMKPWFHLNVYDAAHKYGMEDLVNLAFEGLVSMLPRIRTDKPDGGRGSMVDDVYQVEEVFQLVKALAEHEDYDARFLARGDVFMETHLEALYKLKDFRQWLDEDGNNAALEHVHGIITRGVAARETSHQVQICRVCHQYVLDDVKAMHECKDGRKRPIIERCASLHFNYKSGRLIKARYHAKG